MTKIKQAPFLRTPVSSGQIMRDVLIALLPVQLARHIAEAAGLSVYEPPMAVAPAEIAMVWHRRYSASPPHEWLRGQILELMQRLDDGRHAGT